MFLRVCWFVCDSVCVHVCVCVCVCACVLMTSITTLLGANVHATDLKKQTPLHVAAEEGEEAAVERLLKNKADASLMDYEGQTALELAAKFKWERVFDILITHSSSTKQDENHKKFLKKLMKDGTSRRKDDMVASKLKEMSPLGYVHTMSYWYVRTYVYYNMLVYRVSMPTLFRYACVHVVGVLA